MGVKGLWQILADSGTPVSLESLEGKVLAVDVSIWFHQAMHGYKSLEGSSSNSHLLIMFHRICKLLYYRIRPIFIFDGSAPYLKKQTIAARRLRKEVAYNKVQRTRERLLANLLKSQAVRKALGKKGPGPSLHHVPKQVKKEKDLFELPKIDPNNDSITQILLKDDFKDRHAYSCSSQHKNLHNFDVQSNEFKSLNIYGQHDILFDLQATRKENSWDVINEMPQKATDFSQFQMNRLLKRQKFQETLDDIRIKIQKQHSAEMEMRLLGELEDYVSHVQKIVSEDSAHSILSKKSQTLNIQNSEQPSTSSSPKKCSKKDFLFELSKSGLMTDLKDDQFIESDNESFSSDDDVMQDCENPEFPPKKKQKNEENNFMKIMNYVLDDSELTQEEILAVIKQTKNESAAAQDEIILADDELFSEDLGSLKKNNLESPTSNDQDKYSSLNICKNPLRNISSQEGPSDKQNVNKDSNIKAILGAKTNSLYMKIIQQKLDEIVNQPDSNNIPLDTRKIGTKAIPQNSTSKNNKSPEKVSCYSGKSTKESIPISLDLNKFFKDDIFQDIFSKKELLNKDDHISSVSNKEQTCKLSKGESLSKLDHSVSEKCSNLQPSDDTKQTNVVSIEKLALETLVSSHGNISDHLQARVNELVKIEIRKFFKAEEEEKKKALDISTDQFYKPEANCPPDQNYPKNMNTENSYISSESDSSSDFIEVEECPVNISERLDKTIDLNSQNQVIDTWKIPDTELENNYAKSFHIKKFSEGNFVNESANAIKSFQKADTANKLSLFHSENTDSLSNNQHKCKTVIQHNATYSFSNKPHSDSDTCLKDNNTSTLNSRSHDEMDDDSSSTDDSLIDAEEPVHYPDTNKVSEKGPSKDSSLEKNPLPISTDQLTKIEKELASEQEQLYLGVNNYERKASSLDNETYSDAQELLQLFGLPYLVAPAEAEAQCAFLETVNLSQGTITDDSDIFLFGGKRVYKNFFLQSKHVEVFQADNINRQLGLDREKMISLALLTGSDYTMGIESIGNVLAMEILSEFPGKGIDKLNNLKKWWDASHNKTEVTSPSKIKRRLKALYFHESFPNENIFKAYLSPDVDESQEQFSWAYPDADRLKVFAMQRFGWSISKIEEILNPLFKKIGTNLSQRRLDSYFDIKLTKDHKHASKRLTEAIAKVKGGSVEENNSQPIAGPSLKAKKIMASKLPMKKGSQNGAVKEIPQSLKQDSNFKIKRDCSYENQNEDSSDDFSLCKRFKEFHKSDSDSRIQKRAKEFNKLFHRHAPESTQANADKLEMENRKKAAAAILQRSRKHNPKQ